MFKTHLYFHITCLLFLVIPTIHCLLYPQGALSLISSVSVPVTEYFPERDFKIDWCFLISYNLPQKASELYNIPVWPVKNKRDTDSGLALNLKYTNNTLKNRHYNDFSAGELYQAVEDFLVGFGFHDTCLLRMICELAQHPFDEKSQNYVTDIITFILTPSLHRAFENTEHLYRELYSNAEIAGFLGKNCTFLYTECKHNVLDYATHIIYEGV